MNVSKNKTKLAIAAVIISLVFVGCGKDKDATEPTSNNAPFTFLKVGNEWVYGYYDWQEDTLSSTYKESVVSEENGCFKIITDGSWYSYYSYYFTNDDGYYHTASPAPEAVAVASLYLPRNCYVGLKYSRSNFNDTAEIISVSRTVTVPAGTFRNCIKVKWHNPSDKQHTFHFYYHKDIGLIMQENEDGKAMVKLHSKNF